MNDSEAKTQAAADTKHWEAVADSPEFKGLIAAKAKFIIPVCIFFLVYYFALPLLVGLAPDLMSKKLWGVVNVAYVFALSQFFMTWIISIVYARAAAKFDTKAQDVIDTFHV
ncbi:MAG: DUF485 domain-containing protein [Verrucomicrobiae bacterium]|nr:DUF485 domain-containing protein [Verrucomicrobiae bacterium]